MSKTASMAILITCAMVSAGALAGCSIGVLPGGRAGTAAALSAPSSNSLIAVPKSCPKASEISALAGFTVPDPTVTRKNGALDCSYEGSSSADAIRITFSHSDSHTSAASLQDEMEAVAASLSEKSTIAALPGYGQAAYNISAKNAAGVEVWNKGVIFDVIDNDDLAGIDRVAKGVLAG